MKTSLEARRRRLFLGKSHAAGNLSVPDYVRLLGRALRRGGPGPLVNYLRYALTEREPSMTTLPVVAVAYVNSACNLDCRLCCYGLSRTGALRKERGEPLLTAPEMTLDSFRRIRAHRIFSRAAALVLSGGEPMMNANLFAIIREAARTFPLIHLTTNGTLIEEKLDRLVASPLTHINISLDAVDPGAYGEARKRSLPDRAFRRVIQGARKLAGAKKAGATRMQIIASFLVGKHNYRDMPAIAEAALELGADYINFQNVVPFNCAEMAALSITDGDGEILGFFESFRERFPMSKIAMPRIVCGDKSVRGCRQPFDSLAFDGDGFTGPCSVMVPRRDGEYGNLFDRDWSWNDPRTFLRLRRDLLDAGRELSFPLCRDCAFLHGDIF